MDHRQYTRLHIGLVFLVVIIGGCHSGTQENKVDSTKAPQIDTSYQAAMKIRPFVPIAGEYILTFNEDTAAHNFNGIRHFKAPALLTKANLQSTLARLNQTFQYLRLGVKELRRINARHVVVRLDAGRLQLARKDPRFKYVDTNYVVTRPFGQRVSRNKSGFAAVEANYGINMIMNSPRSDVNSAKRVWLIDGGVDKDHQDLNIDKTLSRSFVENVPYYQDTGTYYYHATHVAGIIGAKRDHGKVIGVAPNADIVVLKVVHNDKIPNYDRYLDALQMVLDLGRPGDVLNLSIENTPGKDKERDLIAAIGAKGIYVVIAAGNDTADMTKRLIYPAAFTGKNIYTVASCDGSKRFSYFSNFGKPPVIYFAPGEEIFSTIPGNHYDFDSGTSQAAPQVSGLLFLGCQLKAVFTAVCPGDHQSYSLVHE